MRLSVLACVTMRKIRHSERFSAFDEAACVQIRVEKLWSLYHAYPVSAQRGARQNRQHSSQTAGSVLCAAPSARVTTRPRQTRTVTLESH